MQDVENSVVHLFAGMPAKKRSTGVNCYIIMVINSVMWNHLFAL